MQKDWDMKMTYLTFWTILVKKLKEELNIRKNQRRKVSIRKTNKKERFLNCSNRILWIPKYKANNKYQKNKMKRIITRIMKTNRISKEQIKEKDFPVKYTNRIKAKNIVMK